MTDLDMTAPRKFNAQTQPTLVAQVAHVVLGALVAIGWASFDDAWWSIVTSAVALVLSFAAQLWARRRTTPTADPRTDSGRLLVPVGPAPLGDPQPPDVEPGTP